MDDGVGDNFYDVQCLANWAYDKYIHELMICSAQLWYDQVLGVRLFFLTFLNDEKMVSLISRTLFMRGILVRFWARSFSLIFLMLPVLRDVSVLRKYITPIITSTNIQIAMPLMAPPKISVDFVTFLFEEMLLSSSLSETGGELATIARLLAIGISDSGTMVFFVISVVVVGTVVITSVVKVCVDVVTFVDGGLTWALLKLRFRWKRRLNVLILLIGGAMRLTGT